MRQMPGDRDNELLGSLLSIAGFAAFSAVDAISKTLSQAHSLPQILFLSGIFALLSTLPLASLLGGIAVRSLAVFTIIVARGVMSAGMIWLTLYAVKLMPIANVYSIRFFSPVITLLLALAILQEAPRRMQWLAVALGFAGIVLMLKPGGDIDPLAAGLALAAAVAQSVSIILVRVWKAYSTPLADMMIPLAILVLATSFFLPANYRSPNGEEWILYVAAGVLLAVGRLCLTFSIRLAPSSTIASIQYTQLLWGVLFGWLLFSELPTISILAGSLLIVAASVFSVRQR